MWWRYLTFIVLPLLMAITAGMAFHKRRDAYILVTVGGVLIYAIPTYNALTTYRRPGVGWWAVLMVASWFIGVLVMISAISHWVWWKRRRRRRDDERASSPHAEAGTPEGQSLPDEAVVEMTGQEPTKPSTCPFCRSAVSFAAVAKAPLPNKIRCQACGERIRLERMGRFLASYMAVALLITIGVVVAFGGVLNTWGLLLVLAAVLFLADFLFSVAIARTSSYSKPKHLGEPSKSVPRGR